MPPLNATASSRARTIYIAYLSAAGPEPRPAPFAGWVYTSRFWLLINCAVGSESSRCNRCCPSTISLAYRSMGNAVSEPVLQRHLVSLSDFAGDQQLDKDNQVWRQLFAFPVSLSQLPPSQVEQHVAGCCDQLGMTVFFSYAPCLTHIFVQYTKIS